MYHLHFNTSKPLNSHGGTTEQDAIQTVSLSHFIVNHRNCRAGKSCVLFSSSIQSVIN